MKKVVCILSDALRYDYINKYNLTFFKERINQKKCFYAEKIIPATGYCEIVEFITGKETQVHNMFTQITAKQDWYNKISNKFLNGLNVIYNNFAI